MLLCRKSAGFGLKGLSAEADVQLLVNLQQPADLSTSLQKKQALYRSTNLSTVEFTVDNPKDA